MKEIVVKLLKGDNYKTPKYITNGSSCMDLYSNNEKGIVLKKGEFGTIPTGLKLSIP